VQGGALLTECIRHLLRTDAYRHEHWKVSSLWKLNLKCRALCYDCRQVRRTQNQICTSSQVASILCCTPLCIILYIIAVSYTLLLIALNFPVLCLSTKLIGPILINQLIRYYNLWMDFKLVLLEFWMFHN
jgi:hypothetical protein